MDYWTTLIIQHIIPAFFDSIERQKKTREYRTNLRTVTADTVAHAASDSSTTSQTGLSSDRAERVDKWLDDMEAGLDSDPDEDTVEESDNAFESQGDEIELELESEHENLPTEEDDEALSMDSFSYEIIQQPSFTGLRNEDSFVEPSVMHEQYLEINRMVRETLGLPPRIQPCPQIPRNQSISEVIPDSEMEIDASGGSAKGNSDAVSEGLSNEDVEDLNRRTSAIMNVQQAHDNLWRAVKELALTAGSGDRDEVMKPYKRYLTPAICDRLQDLSGAYSEVSLDMEPEEGYVGGDEEEDQAAGLVPLKRQRLEKRIQSYRDR